MKDRKGRFVKGCRSSPATEFKWGQHWRPHAIFREKAYLEWEYLDNRKSCQEIADENGVTRGAIDFWLAKHGIKKRTTSEARAVKYWGSSGRNNGMFGKKGHLHPNWNGGSTPDRQAFYASIEWRCVVKQVWERDCATCQKCGVKADHVLQFAIHHIVSFKVVELRAELTNLVLLCADCHRWVHSKENKDRQFIKEAFE
jgi:hypothetical protein